MLNTNEVQRRFIQFDSQIAEFELTVRDGEGKEAYLIKGTPIVYNRECVLYENEDFRFVEIIEQGAARDALLRAEQVLLWNHDSSKPMAARKNNTLAAREDSSGVHIEADTSGTAWGREGFEAVKAGLVDKMSFGFFIKPEGYTEERSVENGKRVLKRTLKKFDRIVDFSPVTYPAYLDTGISARDAESAKAEFEAGEIKSAAVKEKIGGLLKEFPEEKLE
jgi:HK97 family phage prohead protease